MVEPVTGEQIKQERTIFNKTWEVLKKYYNMQQDSPDEDWEALVNEARDIYKLQTGSSKPHELSKQLALAVLDHIELMSKDRQKAREDDSY